MKRIWIFLMAMFSIVSFTGCDNTERKNYRYILTEWMNIEDDENQ